jgi:23S rRNA (cytosine1962-C5)-methyltransferase
MAFQWATPSDWQSWSEPGTEVWRVGAGSNSWLEWWQGRLLLSAPDEATARRMLDEWQEQPLAESLPTRAIFFRELVQNPRPGQVPAIWSGTAEDAQFVMQESGLRYAINLVDGYSPGLFPDQRENRRFLQEKIAERSPGARVLNTFAYTGAFAVAAAAAGAHTLCVDLSKRFLAQARENFSLNALDPTPHRWIPEDVLAFLPRLQRRGEKFAFLILDPPTFSRGEGGRVFRVEKDFPRLLEMALAVAECNAWLLLSTNCRAVSLAQLTAWMRAAAPGARLIPGSPPPDFSRGPSSTTLWAQLA